MCAEMRRPVIGIAPKWRDSEKFGSETLQPEETIACGFMEAILAAGGLPVMLPFVEDGVKLAVYFDLIDGLAIPGGPDVSPALWGDARPYEGGKLCPQRDALEVPLVRLAAERGIPILGVCRGAQVMNVAMGGTLCMDVASLPVPKGMVHWRHNYMLEGVAHPVEVEEGSLLWRACGGNTLLQSNSCHHCCMGEPAPGLRVTAHATDGVPESIEMPGHPFFLGVQWHPEYTWREVPADFAIWCSLVEAAREVCGARTSGR